MSDRALCPHCPTHDLRKKIESIDIYYCPSCRRMYTTAEYEWIARGEGHIQTRSGLVPSPHKHIAGR